jgi:hypothetical protein
LRLNRVLIFLLHVHGLLNVHRQVAIIRLRVLVGVVCLGSILYRLRRRNRSD